MINIANGNANRKGGEEVMSLQTAERTIVGRLTSLSTEKGREK
jgi:hypothetical protein